MLVRIVIRTGEHYHSSDTSHSPHDQWGWQVWTWRAFPEYYSQTCATPFPPFPSRDAGRLPTRSVSSLCRLLLSLELRLEPLGDVPAGDFPPRRELGRDDGPASGLDSMCCGSSGMTSMLFREDILVSRMLSQAIKALHGGDGQRQAVHGVSYRNMDHHLTPAAQHKLWGLRMIMPYNTREQEERDQI